MRVRKSAAAVGGVLAAVLVASGGSGAQAIVAGDSNGAVVYAVPQANGWVVVNSDGTNRRLVSDFEQAKYTAFSRDGSELAVVGLSVTGDLNLYLAEALNGGRDTWRVNYRPQSGVDLWGDVHEVAWEADGQHVVFSQVSTSDGFSRILRQNVNAFSPTAAVEISDQHASSNVNPTVAPNGDVAWQYNGQIVERSPGAPASSVLIASGQNPAYSPDGTKIAFLRNLGTGFGYDLLVADADGTNESVLRHNATSMNSPAWSPDGTRILVKWEGSNGKYIVNFPVGAGTALAVSNPRIDVPATPTWQPIPGVKDKVIRLSGGDRIATGIAAAVAAYPTDNTADAVVLARSDDFADALAGGALAVKSNGPLLLNPTASLDPRISTEITRTLNPAGAKKCYLLGGVGALSADVETSLATLCTVTRIAGTDRFDTSVKIAQELTPVVGDADEILLATGKNYPDALSASAAAASYWGPTSGPGSRRAVVLLTNSGVMPASVAAFINAQKAADPTNTFVTTIGGVAALAYPAMDLELSGGDRYQTSTYVAEAFFGSPSTVGLATGAGFADALSGAAVVGARNGPLLLTPPGFLPGGLASESGDNYLHWLSASIKEGIIFGGIGAVSSAVATATRAAIGVGTTYQEGGPISVPFAPVAKAARVGLVGKGNPTVPFELRGRG